LARSGATVVTTTFPDIAQILPIGRVLASRVVRINDEIRTAAERRGFRLVDLYDAPSMADPETWSPDRIHGSTKGHLLFAAAAAEALALPGSNHDWAQANGALRPSLRSQAHSQVLWTNNMLIPWIWRHARGRSAGDGRGPKRPRLERQPPRSRVSTAE
jgi:lysophospholipase L1-like esterase